MKNIFSKFLVSTFIVILCFSFSNFLDIKAQQQTTESYSDDFSSDSGLWTYLGNAYREEIDQTLVLNKGEWFQRGIVFFKHPISSSFTVSFSYLIGEGYAGLSGDALIMFFYTPNNSTLLGSGPASQSNSGYGIEFDGWPNWASDFVGLNGGLINPPTGDPYDTHIALIEGSVGNHIVYTANDPRVSDYVWHHVIVQVGESSVSVYVDDGLVLQWTGILNRTYSGFGFAGLTGGGATNYHIMDDFSITFSASTGATSNPTPTSLSRINTVIETISPFGWPCDLAVSPNGLYAYVANSGDSSVSIISTASNEATEKILIGRNPSALAISHNGEYAYVACDRYWSNWWHNGSVLVINTATKNVETNIPIGYNSNDVIVSPDGRYVYVANSGDGSVYVINAATNTVMTVILVGSNINDLAVSSNGAYIYVAGDGLVSVIDTTTNMVIATVPVGDSPSAVAVSPNGEFVYVTNRGDGLVSVIDTKTNTINVTISLEDKPWGYIQVVLPSGSEQYVTSSTRPYITEPCSVAISPNGQYAYIANHYTLTVSVIKLAKISSPSLTFQLMLAVTTIIIGLTAIIVAYIWKKKT